MSEWQVVIGLEIHVRLKTQSKLFSGSSTSYGAEPNTQASVIDLAMPGTLPAPNEHAIRMAIAFGLAVGSDIAPVTQFARKHYFYPDLPKGYQISQLETPIVSGGHIEVPLADGTTKTVNLTRAHLEEDAGKSMHEGHDNSSYIDLNRAGTALIEIVSEPEMNSAAEAGAYMRKIHSIVCTLDICDGNMQEGSFRCDANISMHRKDDAKLGTRNEIKNINSFRFVEQALEYEIARQTDVLESGGKVVQQTRLYDPDKNETRVMREKEEADDYRYFPDPDLLPIQITDELIDEVRQSMHPSSEETASRLRDTYGFSDEECARLEDNRELLKYFEDCAQQTKAQPPIVLNWVLRHLSDALKSAEMDVAQSPVSPEQFARILDKIESGAISDKAAREVFKVLWSDGGDIDDIISSRQLEQVSDEAELEKVIAQCCAENAEQVEQYRSGKTKVLGFLVGQILKATQGKANPAVVNQLLKNYLDKN